MLSALLFALSSLAFAQKSSPQVLNASGGFFKNTDFSVAYSVGECAITYLTSPIGGISQGFLQVETLIINATEAEIDNTLLVFPNPVHDKLYLRSQFRVIAGVQVFDMLGRKTLQTSLSGESLDLSQLSPGIYLLHLSDTRQRFFQTVKIEKL